MKKIAKPIPLKRAFIFFFLSGTAFFLSGSLNAQVFEPGVRSVYSGFAFDKIDTLSADTLIRTFVPLVKDDYEVLPGLMDFNPIFP